MPVQKSGSVVRERETMERHANEEGGLKEIARTDFGENKVAYISDKMGLHEIINPSLTEYAVSLHRKSKFAFYFHLSGVEMRMRGANLNAVYTPPNAATYGCHVYDPVTGESKHVMQSAYDSVRGVVGGVE